MTVLLELPAELEQELSRAAEKAGMSLEDYSLRLLAMRSQPGDIPETGAELMDYWRRLGVIGMRTDIADSAKHARLIRAGAEDRTQITNE